MDGPDSWNQVLDNALREPAARWVAEGIGFRLATDYGRAQKKRRGSSGSVMDCGGGRLLHHLCWADDVYAMAETLDHLTCILKDMRDSIERLGMHRKGEEPRYCCRAIH